MDIFVYESAEKISQILKKEYLQKRNNIKIE